MWKAIKQILVNRSKELNRTMKGIIRESTIGKVEKKPLILISPVLPAGEDEHSFSRHNF